MLAPTLAPARSQHRHIARASAPQHQAYPWDESEYAQVQFMPPPFGPILISKEPKESVFKAVLVLQRVGNLALTEDAQALEVFISGDSALGIYALLNGQATERPMALDVLWQMWQAGKEEWKLLRVAVVELKNDVFVARLFFGDPATGEIKWDCDCRPSDATFLAMKSSAPIFVHKRVWDEAATLLKDTHAYDYIKQLHAQTAKEPEPQRAGSGASTASPSGTSTPLAAVMELPDSSTLLPISLLLRDMEEAVAQEDYVTAAQIRDHPWMRMHGDIEMHKGIGSYDRAKELYVQLKLRIESDTTQAVISGNSNSLEARIISRARAEKQREAALRAMKTFRVVDHPPMKLPSRDGQKMDKARKPHESNRGDMI